MEHLWNILVFIFSVRDPLAICADPITILAVVGAVGTGLGLIEGQDQKRKANNEADRQKAETAAREQQLADEAAAKAAAAKKAESAGQRAGFGSTIASAFSSRSAAFSATGFGNNAVREDNIGRGALFGN